MARPRRDSRQQNGIKVRGLSQPTFADGDSALPHFASLNWREAKEWKKDGSLVVTIDTMIDGEGSSITATRTVVLGIDQVGKARIVKSTIKYKT